MTQTDFFADLEVELLDAARRRAAATRRPRPRPRLVPAVALAAAFTVVAATLIALPRDAPPPRTVAPPTLAPRGETVVSVLNGTTRPGLARRTADTLIAAGFPRDTTINTWRNQAVKRSRVLHVEGSAAEARGVARRLGIATVRPGSPTELSIGGAQVVVVLGADQARRPAEDESRVGADARIVVADAGRGPSRDRRLGVRVRDRLRGVDYTSVRLFTRPLEDTQRRSVVEYGPGARAVAERIAAFLRIEAVGPAPMPDGTDVKVVIGSDYARTR